MLRSVSEVRPAEQRIFPLVLTRDCHTRSCEPMCRLSCVVQIRSSHAFSAAGSRWWSTGHSSASCALCFWWHPDMRTEPSARESMSPMTSWNIRALSTFPNSQNSTHAVHVVIYLQNMFYAWLMTASSARPSTQTRTKISSVDTNSSVDRDMERLL